MTTTDPNTIHPVPTEPEVRLSALLEDLEDLRRDLQLLEVPAVTTAPNVDYQGLFFALRLDVVNLRADIRGQLDDETQDRQILAEETIAALSAVLERNQP